MFLDRNLLKRCLFIDIETVSQFPDYTSLPIIQQELWSHKCTQIKKSFANSEIQLSDQELYETKAGIFAEFAKIACISMGFLHFDNDLPGHIRLKSLSGENEYQLLKEFSEILTNHYNDPDNSRICGHNIKEFDIPFLCRRMVINQIQFPQMLDISGKKPWQTLHILDTMDMWRFGDYKNYTSLTLLAATLGIDSPKDDIDGSMVGKVFWEENDVQRIAEYCQKDVVTVIQIMMKYAGLPIFSEQNIESIK